MASPSSRFSADKITKNMSRGGRFLPLGNFYTIDKYLLREVGDALPYKLISATAHL